MRNYKYQLLSLFLILTLMTNLITLNNIHGATENLNGNSINVYVDGVKVNFDVEPMIINGRTMVPLRAIFEAVGAQVVWDQERQLVIGIKDDKMVTLYIGSVSPTVNDEIRELSVPATIVNNRTLAPLRFVGEAFGGTVTWDGATRTVNIYTTNITNTEYPKVQTDFQIQFNDISFVEDSHVTSGFVRPGTKIRIDMKVHKLIEETAGGGHLILKLNGKKIDQIPFFMDSYDTTSTITKYYQLPIDDFQNLAEEVSTIIPFTVEIIQDAVTKDTNTTNNTATLQVDVHGIERAETDVVSNSEIVSIKATSTLGIGVGAVSKALNLSAQVKGTGLETIVYFYVDGQLIEEKLISTSKSGYPMTVTCSYYVPYENNGLVNYSVKLDNGDEAFTPIGIEPFEYEALSDGISWRMSSSTDNYIPGSNLFLTANVLRKNKYSFSSDTDALRCYFLINGVLSEALKVTPPSGSVPYVGKVTYNYPVPSNQTGNLEVKFLVDPGGLYNEEREDNNTATVIIPQLVEGNSDRNNILINSLRFSPSEATPGENIQLIIGVKNNSNVYPSADVGINILANGQKITTSTTTISISKSNLLPGQTYIVSKIWKVPTDISSDITLSVEADPNGALIGDNPLDNIMTLNLPLAKPDLLIETNSLGTSELPVSGNTCQLFGRVYNTGGVNAENIPVAFYIDNVEIGRVTIDLPKRGSLDVRLPWHVPAVQSNNDTLSMYGVPGFSDPPRESKTYGFTMKIDPDNTIVESNENNNITDTRNISAVLISKNARVHVKALNLQKQNIQSAQVQLTTGSLVTTATTDAYGDVTFFNVPYGPYDVSVSKTGYITGNSSDEVLYSGNLDDYVKIYLDNRSIISGIVSGNGDSLDEVTVNVKGSSQNTITNISGNYSLKLYAGTYTLIFAKAGYQFKQEVIHVGSASNMTKNITLTPTDNAYLSGIIYDDKGNRLPNQTVVIKNGSGQTQASVMSDSTGNYFATLTLTSLDMWMNVTSTYHGINRNSNVYLVKGYEQGYDISFKATESPVDATVESSTKVSPWIVCASMPGTSFSPDYKVEAIYGMFNMNLSLEADDSFITSFEIDSEPLYWIYSSVSSSWDPSELLGLNEITEYSEAISAILPMSIPLAVNMHSTNHSKVWIKKIALMSDGQEVDAIYPDGINDKTWSPNEYVNWQTAQIKLYLKVDPDNGVVNPAAGYNMDRVLIIWNLSDGSFEKIGNYQVTGWDENRAREEYMDE